MITLSKSAAYQLQLIRDNDFTLEHKVLRLSIDGKECNGFTYALGFTEVHAQDQIIELVCEDFKINIHLDPFASLYCLNGTIEYLFDPQNDLDGLYFINDDQKEYHGKFFKDPQKIKGLQV